MELAHFLTVGTDSLIFIDYRLHKTASPSSPNLPQEEKEFSLDGLDNSSQTGGSLWYLDCIPKKEKRCHSAAKSQVTAKTHYLLSLYFTGEPCQSIVFYYHFDFITSSSSHGTCVLTSIVKYLRRSRDHQRPVCNSEGFCQQTQQKKKKLPKYQQGMKWTFHWTSSVSRRTVHLTVL